MSVKIVGPLRCEHFGICQSCYSAISAGDDMFRVEQEAHPRDWESVCSRECGEARTVSLIIAGNLEEQASAIRRGQPP